MKTDSEKILKALSDGNRLHLVSVIAKNEKSCARDLLEGIEITQPTLSHHMKVLTDSGLVTSMKEGRMRYYVLDREKAEAFLADLQELLS